MNKPIKYRVKITDVSGSSSYLVYRDRTEWCLKVAKHHAKTFNHLRKDQTIEVVEAY